MCLSLSPPSGILLSIHPVISIRICSNVPEKDICMVCNVDDEANETTSADVFATSQVPQPGS